MYLDKLDSQTQRIVRAAYPNYNGRKFELKIASHPLDVRSYWDGGSRDYFVFVNLATCETLAMPPQSAFDKQITDADKVNLPEGFVCVQHSIFCGKDSGLTIFVHPNNAPLLLPAPQDELSEDQKLVLLYTRCRKSSYAGKNRLQMAIEDMRFARKEPITQERWETAKASLIASGHLNKAGAITPQGRNATEDKFI